MADYKKLQYSIGGGIISDAQLDLQNGSATIAIGLGGTGKDAVKRLKKEVCRRVKSDNTDELVGRYDHIKYLCIDSDNYDLCDCDDFIGIDPDSEFFSIQGDAAIFKDEKFASILAGKPYAKWLNCRNIMLQSNQGAGAVRQIGRYFLIDKSNALINKLVRIFTEAVSNSRFITGDCREVNIHIMTGLGGGTGSGIFLDVCYIVRQAVSICQALENKKVCICGYFFMPDVNLSKVKQESARNYIMYNSYAAMKELDYCMSFPENGDKWDQQYDGFRITTAQPPVDMAHLVSAQSVSGNVNTNGYECAIGVVSDYIVQFIADDDIFRDTHHGISMGIHISNLLHVENFIPKQHGGNYKYVIIGSSYSPKPKREAATYLTSKLFEKMAERWSEPTDTDIADLCESIGLSVEKLTSDIGGFSIDVPVINNVYDKLPTDDSGDKYESGYVLPDGILTQFNNQERKIFGDFEKSSDALTNEWKPDTDFGDNPVSIVCRVFKALDEVALDTKRGPIYAAKMLFGSDKKNIINIISGIEAIARTNRDDTYYNIDLTVKAVKQARTDYNNRPKVDLFGKKKNELFGNLLNAIRNDISRRCEYERYKYLCEALDTAKEQLLALYNEYFKKYADVMLDLKRVFAANALAIANLQNDNSDPFMLPMFNIRDLCSTLDEEVKKLSIGTEIANFNYAFYKKAYTTWHSGNEELISAWISKYMSIIFRNLIALTFDDVPMLTNTVCDKIIKELDDKASEMFLLDGTRAPRVQAHTYTYTYCSAADTAPVLNDAINRFKGGNPSVQIVSESRNRVFFLKITPCVPMFAYGLIDEMFAAYNEARAVTGKHLYEGSAANGDTRNWQTLLPDLRPYSIYKDIDWTTPEKTATANAYGEAENIAGIIHSEVDSNTGIENGHYYIWRTPDYMPQLEEAKKLADEAQKIAADEKSTLEDYQDILKELNKVQNDLKSYKEGLIDYTLTHINGKLTKPEIPPISIRNDGDETAAFDVRRDYMLASPVLMHIVEEELNKVKTYKAVTAQLSEVTAAVSAKLSRIENRIKLHETEQSVFINAVLSGVITYNKYHRVIFEDRDEFGFENSPDIELSDPASKPFGCIAPLYQAFDTYCDLPEETRSIIHAKVNQRLDGVDENNRKKDWTEIMREEYNNLSYIFNPMYVQIITMNTMELPERTDIINLYKSFLTALQQFKFIYLQ